MAEGVSGSASETNGASRLDLPHLTRRELLSHRAELETRRTMRFENAAKDVPPLCRGMRDEDV